MKIKAAETCVCRNSENPEPNQLSSKEAQNLGMLVLKARKE